jgi:hypothetical protein
MTMPKTCGICSEPFKDGEIAVQAAQYEMWKGQPILGEQIRAVKKFWAHPVCLFAVAREEEAAPSEKQKSK